tara:strand:+ start:9688 stop:10974 length:1287 start_codon:yes stop_codon:yes gene_type:complete
MKLIPEELKGQGLHVYCNKCKRQLSADSTCKDSGSDVKSCQSKEKWKYKMVFHVPQPNGPGKKKTTISKAKTLTGAIKELEEKKKEMKSGFSPIRKERTLKEGIQLFLEKKFGTGEYSDVETKLSKQHQQDILRVVERFLLSLKRSGKNPDVMLLNDLDDSVLAPFYKLLREEFEIGRRTRDRHTRIMRSFMRFLEDRGIYNGGNFFMTHSVSAVNESPVAVTDQELEKVLSSIKPENGWGIKGTNRRKYYYRDWLPFMFRLARLTGLRNEELYQLSVNDIKEFEKDGEKFKLIVTHNLKVERLKAEEEKEVLKVIPVTAELESLLEELREHNISSDKVVETNLTLGPFKDFIGRAFTHFYKTAFPGQQHKVFKQIRKANYSEIAGLLGEQAKHLTGHTEKAILDKHYVDKIMAAMKLMEIKKSEKKS